MTKCSVSIDSNARFDNYNNGYLRLPCGKYGFNNFKVTLRNDILYYKGRPVIDTTQNAPVTIGSLTNRGQLLIDDDGNIYESYYVYLNITGSSSEMDDYYINTAWIFDDVMMYDAHIHVDIYRMNKWSRLKRKFITKTYNFIYGIQGILD